MNEGKRAALLSFVYQSDAVPHVHGRSDVFRRATVGLMHTGVESGRLFLFGFCQNPQ